MSEPAGPTYAPDGPVEGNGSAPKVDVASLSPFELNYRKAMGALIQAMNISATVSNLDVRRNQLELIVKNQIVLMQALMLTMDFLLQVSGRPAEIQFTRRESSAGAPSPNLVVPS